MIDITAARAAIAAAITQVAPELTVHTIEPEQIRPPAATIAPADPWITLDNDDHTYADLPLRWTIRLIVEAGPAADVANRLDAAASALADLNGPGLEVVTISTPHTLVINDSQAFPALTATITQWIERN